MEKLLQSIQKPTWRHLPFWMLYWLYSSTQTLFFYDDFFSNLFTEAGFTIVIATCVYINLGVFIPRFLITQKYLRYIVLVIVLAIIASWLINEGYALLFYPVEIDFFGGWQGKLVLFTDIILMTAFTMSIYFLIKWRERDRYAKDLEQKNLETELALLKSQINPHFVFNILNAIYHLIAKDATKAQHLLSQFSDILSHQIYDSAQAKIDLEKEISYLEKYIEIEKLRSGDLVDLSYDLPTHGEGYSIAPMLMLPLIENAFKHSKSAHGSKVDIHMSIQNDQLSLDIENSINPHQTSSNGKGIGIPNVKRRLELLYPDQHKFVVSKDQGKFYTRLNISLHEVEVSDH